jgi:hypothetical protein
MVRQAHQSGAAAGNVNYYGNPTTTQSITGFGNLNNLLCQE